mmetsp:Transcript_33718/g.81763  ORF Transcript_33718/g.81763 Transcript_33718/m.81763 type:complete len:492 (+) Transcript_33718:84-1559(+)
MLALIYFQCFVDFIPRTLYYWSPQQIRANAFIVQGRLGQFSTLFFLIGHTGDLSKHLQSVGVHNSNTPKSGALLERLKEKRSGGLEFNLGILELRKLGGVLDLGTSSLLGLLPQDLGHLTCDLGGTGEDNWTVSGLQNTRVLLDGNHGSESLDGGKGTFLLKVDDVTWVDLLVLGNTLDGHTNRVSWSGRFQDLLVLFDGEHLLVGKTRGDNSDNISRAKSSLFDGTADDLTNTLNIVDVRDGKTKRSIGETLGGYDEVVEAFNKGESSDLLLGSLVGGPSLVPGSLIGLLNQVVSVESRVWDERNLLGLEADQLKHLNEFVLDFVETVLRPVAGVHLVDSNNDLLNTEQVKKTGVLTSLSFLNSQLSVSLGNGGFESTLLGRDKKKTDISGGRSGDHVLDVILVAGGIDNSVVVLVSEELLGVTLDGNTTFTFLLTGIKVVGETERGLSLFFGNSLELCHLTIRDSSLLEDKVTTGGTLTGIDVSADNKR